MLGREALLIDLEAVQMTTARLVGDCCTMCAGAHRPCLWCGEFSTNLPLRVHSKREVRGKEPTSLVGTTPSLPFSLKTVDRNYGAKSKNSKSYDTVPAGS